LNATSKLHMYLAFLPALRRDIIVTSNPNRMRVASFVTAMSWCTADAWMSTTTNPQLLRTQMIHPTRPQTSFMVNRDSSSRLYFSSQNDKGDDLISKAKSWLPKKWFGTEEEKMAIQRRKEVKDTVSSNLDEMLKDAPLGFRMLGKMVSPLMSAAASTMAETMAEQQRTTASVLEDARMYLESDSTVSEILGSPIQIGAPFSQASSSSNVNGVKQSRVELALPVTGSFSSGVARILANQDGIVQLQVDVGGRVVNVSLSKDPKRRFKSQSTRTTTRSGDDIIEAEIVEKDTKY